MKFGRLGWFACAALAFSCASEDTTIRVEQTQRMGFSTGRPTSVPLANRIIASASITFDSGGTPKTIEGIMHADGSVTFQGVPQTSYMLELRRTVPANYPDDPPMINRLWIDGDRHVTLGTDFWGRHDVEALDDTTTTFTLALDDATGFTDGDSLEMISLGSYLSRTLYLDSTSTTQTNPPADGATTSSGWYFPASEMFAEYGLDASGLPSAARGDVLTLIHSRSEILDLSADMRDPYRTLNVSRPLSALHIPNATLTNASDNAISGTMTELPRTPFAIDFRGSSFAALRQTLGYPDEATSSMNVCLYQEPGAGPGYFAGVSPESFCLTANSRKAAANPACYPDAIGTCDAVLCPGGCDTTLSTINRDPGDLNTTLDVPRVYATGLRDVLSISYGFSRTWTHPVEGGTVNTSAFVGLALPPSSQTGPIELTLAPATDVRLDGVALPYGQDTTIASSTPTLTFTASPGAELYNIELIELRPDVGSTAAVPRGFRGAATMMTPSTTVELPPNVLRSGHYYYLRIQARQDGTDTANYLRNGSDTVRRTTTMSGVFTL